MWVCREVHSHENIPFAIFSIPHLRWFGVARSQAISSHPIHLVSPDMTLQNKGYICYSNQWWLVVQYLYIMPWWRHPMEAFSALLALCARNSPVTGEFLAQRPVTRSLDVFFDLRLNKPLSKQSRGWWFETPSRSLWRRCNGRGIFWCHDDLCWLLYDHSVSKLSAYTDFAR